MPRTLTSNALAAIATNTGMEPVFMVDVQWVINGPTVTYADRPYAGLPQKIIDIQSLDDTVDITGGGQSQQVTITLDDTNKAIKGIIDANDPHKRSVSLYQSFTNLALSDRFLIFRGVINTPVEWNEGDRTFKFDVISRIEDVEVGFSIEEGNFVNPPQELIGVPWPLAFGSVVNLPALRTQGSATGILATGTGIHDFTLTTRINAAHHLVCPQVFTGFTAKTIDLLGSLEIDPNYVTDPGCLQQICQMEQELNLELSEQLQYEINPITIFGGNNFPQHTSLVLNINGGRFYGAFNGEQFNVTARIHPLNNGSNGVIVQQPRLFIQDACANVGVSADQMALWVQEGSGNGVAGSTPTLNQRASAQSFYQYSLILTAGFFYAAPGSTVTIDGGQSILYICNLLPSTITRVAAMRTLAGVPVLLTVPSSYYTVQEVNYSGTYPAGYTGVTQLLFSQALSTRDLDTGGGWADDIYVCLTSSVGPNTVDILKWFIQTYTSYGVDNTSFNAVRAAIDNYPMNFWLKDRENILQVLQEIAYQARCALYLRDNVFFIKYLAQEPSVDLSVGEDDIVANSLILTHTETEKLITKYTAQWEFDYAATSPNYVVLRYNVLKYGTHAQTDDFYCFNDINLVRKAATFWIIRKGNTWRRAVFKTPLTKLSAEVFDCIQLTLPDLAPNPIKGLVEQATYNPADNTIDFQVWTPLQSGSTTAYNFAYPAAVGEFDIFPTENERAEGFAGSGQQPNFATIAPNLSQLSPGGAQGIQGFELACNGAAVISSVTGECRPDFGDKFPSDVGDTKPRAPVLNDDSGGVNGGLTSPITSGSNQGSSSGGIGGGGSAANGGCGNGVDPCSLAQQAMRSAASAQDTANAALAQAQATAKATKTQKGGNNKDGSDSTDPRTLLPNNQCITGNCQAMVVVDMLQVESVLRANAGSGGVKSQHTDGCGDTDNGQILHCQECIGFNSAEGAREYLDSITSSSGQSCVGDTIPWITSQASSTLGNDMDPTSPNFGNACDEPAEKDREMTTFSQGSEEQFESGGCIPAH